MTKTLYKTNLIIFGGDGDLAFRKIFPAIYYRVKGNQLITETNIIVVSRNTNDVNSFFTLLEEHLTLHIPDLEKSILEKIKNMLSYLKMDLTDSKDYIVLAKELAQKKMEQDVFYYSTSSTLFGTISKSLAENGIINEASKIVLEK